MLQRHYASYFRIFSAVTKFGVCAPGAVVDRVDKCNSSGPVLLLTQVAASDGAGASGFFEASQLRVEYGLDEAGRIRRSQCDLRCDSGTSTVVLAKHPALNLKYMHV